MSLLTNMLVKFFPRDIVSGKAEKAGDEFEAFFLTGNHTFVVQEMCDGFFMATIKQEA